MKFTPRYLLLLVTTLGACGENGRTGSALDPNVPVPGSEGALKSPALVRASRRLYDGSPPAIPHRPVGARCTECHDERGLDVPGLGYAPASPHEKTAGMSALSRCEQCHVYRTTEAVFRASEFVGLEQDLRRGKRLFGGAPPVLPHLVQMRENCQACHTGPAAREEIRCSHPDRTRCTQCHVPVTATEAFVRGAH